MKHFQALVLAAFALEGAFGSPAHHFLHRHKRHLDLQPRQDFDKCDIENYKGAPWYAAKKAQGGALDGCPASGTQQKSTTTTGNTPKVENKEEKAPSTSPAENSTPSSSSKSSSSSSSNGNGQCSNLQDAFSNPDTSGGQGPTAASQQCLHKRATAAQVNYAGETGGECYGSNLTPVTDCKPTGQYALILKNGGGSDKTLWAWNKAGPNDGISGMMNHAFWQFKLAAGETAAFDVASGSIVAFSEACGRATGHGGVPKCNVGEVTYHCGAQGCTGGSYYDVSMVTYNQVTSDNPVKVPMTIQADGYDESTTDKCMFTRDDQDHPDDLSCRLGPDSDDGKNFHVVATFH